MISTELEARILRLHSAENWKKGTIANQVGVHHDVVRRVLEQAGISMEKIVVRPSMVDPFIPFIMETLEKYPRLSASNLYQMVVNRGYPGKVDHFRDIIARLRPRKSAEAYLRLKTLPGEQAQVDWAHFGTIKVGRATRKLSAFVMVLSYSRKIFLRFCLDQRMDSFLRGHVAGFRDFGGVPRVLLYDNLKSAVLERMGDAIRFNPTLLELAAHYRYEPRPVAVARGNEKGRVERAIRYVRTSFFAGRDFTDLDDINQQAKCWCDGQTCERKWPEDPTLTVKQAFEQERPLLLPLPDNDFPTSERVFVHAGKVPYVRFDLNDYSIPHDRVGRTLIVMADTEQIRILDGSLLIATHTRTYDKGAQVEDPTHICELIEHKHQARQHQGSNRLSHAVPNSQAFLTQLSLRGLNLGSATAALLRLLDSYGADELVLAIDEALSTGSAHPHAVRHCLERRHFERGQPPKIDIALSDDPKIRNHYVQPHALSQYDSLVRKKENDHDDTK